MKPPPSVMTCLAVAAIFSLNSCASLREAGKSSAAMMKNSTSATVSKISSVAKMPGLPDLHLANILPGNRIKVVEVREKDLKELPMGSELAKAHEQERKSGFWIFGGPVDFKEPSLPEPGTELDGSLLPPRMP